MLKKYTHKGAPLVFVLAASAALSAAALSPAYADIFKYTDDSGIIHFSNVPNDLKNDKVIHEKTPGQVKARQVSVTPDTDKPKAEPAVYTVPNCEPLAEGEPYADLINAKCTKYGVDPKLVKSVMKAESNFNPDAVSNKGAKGLMQLMPSTAADMGVTNIYDPEQNIEGGVKYLRFLLDTFAGDVELSVAAYNCGQGKVIRNGNCVPNIAETKNYVRKVLSLSKNPITGMKFTRTIYKVELKDGSILFSDSPVSGGKVSLVDMN